MKAFYPGSFDPFTNGHLYVVRQAATLFDQVIVGIGINPTKSFNFLPELMRQAIDQTLQAEGLTNVQALVYNSLTSQAARAAGADFLIRGVRNGMDYEFEENLAALNQKFSGLETIYFRGGATAHISSSMVMDLVRFGADVTGLVPPAIQALIKGPRQG